MAEQEAREIYHQGEESVVAKFMEFDARLKRLEDIINTNSNNSSKPPSTDILYAPQEERRSSNGCYGDYLKL